MVTLEERVSWLEGAFQQLMARVETLPTRDEMRAEIRGSEVRMIKWMVGMMVAQAALTVAAVSTAVALVRLTA